MWSIFSMFSSNLYQSSIIQFWKTNKFDKLWIFSNSFRNFFRSFQRQIRYFLVRKHSINARHKSQLFPECHSKLIIWQIQDRTIERERYVCRKSGDLSEDDFRIAYCFALFREFFSPCIRKKRKKILTLHVEIDLEHCKHAHRKQPPDNYHAHDRKDWAK